MYRIPTETDKNPIYYIPRIEIDEDPINPRIDSLGTITIKPQEGIISDADAISFWCFLQMIEECKISDEYIYLKIFGEYNNFNTEVDKQQQKHIGYIYVSKEKVKNIYGYSEMSTNIILGIKRILCREVSEYSGFLAGDIYRYSIFECGFDKANEIGRDLPDKWQDIYMTLDISQKVDFIKEHFWDEFTIDYQSQINIPISKDIISCRKNIYGVESARDYLLEDLKTLIQYS